MPDDDSLYIGQQVARHRLSRRVGAALLYAMAESDTSVAQIAEVLSLTDTAVRAMIKRLTEGEPLNLTQVADLFYASGARVEIYVATTTPRN